MEPADDGPPAIFDVSYPFVTLDHPLQLPKGAMLFIGRGERRMKRGGIWMVEGDGAAVREPIMLRLHHPRPAAWEQGKQRLSKR